MDVYNVIALIIYSLFLFFAIFATFVFGGANFNRIEMKGKY